MTSVRKTAIKEKLLKTTHLWTLTKLLTLLTWSKWWRRHYFYDVIIQHRYFSHVTKSRIFKNLNLGKKKPIATFSAISWKTKSPSWLVRSRCHMGTFWKTKDWSSHFWESQPFRFWYVQVHCQRNFKSTKTGISS